MYKRILGLLLIISVGLLLTSCFRKPIEYKTTELKLSYVATYGDYEDEEVTFLIFASEEEFTVIYPDYGIGQKKEIWPMKYIKDKDRDEEILQYIKEHHHIISEYEDKKDGKIITFNTNDGVIVKYVVNTRYFQLFLVNSQYAEIKGNFEYIFTFPFDYAKESKTKFVFHEDKVIIKSSEYDKDQVLEWYREFCDGRTTDDGFIFSYIKYDFKLTITGNDGEVLYQIEKVA